MSLPSLNFLHLMVAEIWPGQGWYQFPENFRTFKVTGLGSHTMTLLKQTPNRMSLPSLNFLHLMSVDPAQSQDKILTVKVIGSRSKFVSMSHHKVAQLGLPRNVPTKFELPPTYGCFKFVSISGQDFNIYGHRVKVKGHVKVTPWSCTTRPTKECPYQHLRSQCQGQRLHQGHTMTLHN